MHKNTISSIQQLMNKALADLLRQQKVCTDKGMCVYLNDEGNRCAVGHMLSASDSTIKEHSDVFTADVTGLLRNLTMKGMEDYLPYVAREHTGIFCEFQKLHDALSAVGYMQALLNLRDWGIDVTGDEWRDWTNFKFKDGAWDDFARLLVLVLHR